MNTSTYHYELRVYGKRHFVQPSAKLLPGLGVLAFVIMTEFSVSWPKSQPILIQCLQYSPIYA